MYIAIALVLALLVALFALQNATTVVIGFLLWQFKTSLPIVILGAAAAGALAVGILGLVRQMKTGMRLWDANARIRNLEEELKAVRTELERARGALADRAARPAGPESARDRD